MFSPPIRGNLVKKIKPDNTSTIYIGSVYEVQKDSGGTVTGTTTYYAAAGAMRVNGTLYYVLKDKLNSASVVLDSSGGIVGETRYYPFGEARETSGSMLTDHLFTGQREMAGLGLYHYGARFYNPGLGRFIQPDTIVPDPGNPQSLNRFSYVNNNPVRHIDPSGHSPEGACGKGNVCGSKSPPYVPKTTSQSYTSVSQKNSSVSPVTPKTSTPSTSKADNPGPQGSPVNTWDTDTKASDDIIKNIINWEGNRVSPYNDPTNNCTVGIGHMLHGGSCSTEELLLTFSPTQVQVWFDKDLAETESDVRSMFQTLDNEFRPNQPQGNPFPITQAQFDALVSFTFNAGSGTLVELVQATIQPETGTFDYERFSNDMLTIYAQGGPGLLPRRQAEVNLFVDGIYP